MKEARFYLEQVYRIDQRINCKIEQVSSLPSLTTKANSTLTDMHGSPNRNIHRMEDIIIKIIDLESQSLLEQRYLNFRTWEQIAVDMGYNVRHLYRMHDQALKKIQIPKVVT